MGGRQLLKSVGMLDHIKQRNDESLNDFNTCLNKDLAEIDKVITDGETIHAFVIVLGPEALPYVIA